MNVVTSVAREEDVFLLILSVRFFTPFLRTEIKKFSTHIIYIVSVLEKGCMHIVRRFILAIAACFTTVYQGVSLKKRIIYSCEIRLFNDNNNS
ncbi:hypothetical protein BDB00DRAFT_839609 [Zychaea mexicana]|uniref:uncharacterized protein n=1 Tax=Zychaea mexicana TaxID=64656 RepID=UPI0022FE8FB5|nr:uncharacterized protein BDB00DRAFT_839609 [Zychaea mexicana]KAI9490097.1 hypothetical protein BDB00DRAFT_839609 [Zychaea mexicana]